MAYYVRMVLWCDYAEKSFYRKIEDWEYLSEDSLYYALYNIGYDAAHEFAEEYEHLLFNQDFAKKEKEQQKEIIKAYYKNVGFNWSRVEEEEYLENEENWE